MGASAADRRQETMRPFISHADGSGRSRLFRLEPPPSTPLVSWCSGDVALKMVTSNQRRGPYSLLSAQSNMIFFSQDCVRAHGIVSHENIDPLLESRSFAR